MLRRRVPCRTAVEERRLKTAAYSRDPDRWNAVVTRDPGAREAFRYAVRTTGIYCRPGCASRLPRRDNVEYFDTAAAAERAGYRPCRRCRPQDDDGRDPRREAITAACRRLEHEQPPPAVAALAAEAGLSRWHFQRTFKALVGLTPKQYADARRDGRLRRALEGGASVTDAVYAAGFGSSSRVYERADARLGMTPGRYRAGGAGVTLRCAVAASTLGTVGVAASDRGIAAIELADDERDAMERIRARFPRAELRRADAALAGLVRRAVALVEAPGTDAGLPLDIRGTAFQQRVWRALGAIPPGHTASYAEIARAIGRPTAARAVGRAIAANPFAVAVPCHRAVRSDGTPGGYRWGEERKRALLAREARAGDTGGD